MNMNRTEVTLEFNQMKRMLGEYTLSEEAREILSELKPFLSERECRNKMKETTEARCILDAIGSPPLSAMKEMNAVLGLCERGSVLTPEQLESVALFIVSSKKMKAYLKKAEELQVGIAYYGQSICDMTDLRTEIDMAIRNGAVTSSASHELNAISKKLERAGAQIKKKLDDLLRNKKNYFAEAYVSQRNGHFVLPVKKEFKNQVPGAVIDMSATGSTYFIEPASASKLQDEINSLKVEEENEIRKILYTLTALVDEAATEIRINMDAMVALDVAFAKAKLSADMKAIAVTVDHSRTIQIQQGRHPLINKEECVPLDFSIGGDTKGVVITGPNTGGKTVALKTVGLLSMMAQSGLHVPVKSGRFCMNNLILCDIGDGQSITENLSTFSAHITSVIEILRMANDESLVLLDELGSGTDPAEGMGIAVAILEELRLKGCLFLATTHYPEVKEYAAKAEGLANARMAFDRESLKPLYRLEMGEAGESCALYIAQRLGFPAHMLERAYQAVYSEEVHPQQYDKPERPESPALPEQKPYTAPVIIKDEGDRKGRDVSAGLRGSGDDSADGGEGISFQIGDSVKISPDQQLGIVFQPEDKKGDVGVQVKGEKYFVNYKRLKLKTLASELYPPDYDFSIIFDTVENRKARHQIKKGHIEGNVIKIEETHKRL